MHSKHITMSAAMFSSPMLELVKKFAVSWNLAMDFITDIHGMDRAEVYAWQVDCNLASVLRKNFGLPVSLKCKLRDYHKKKIAEVEAELYYNESKEAMAFTWEDEEEITGDLDTVVNGLVVKVIDQLRSADC